MVTPRQQDNIGINGAARVVFSTDADEMSAFDALPQPIRAVLSSSPIKLSAVEAMTALRQTGMIATLRLIQESVCVIVAELQAQEARELQQMQWRMLARSRGRRAA
jgi:hypothetical protein